MRVIMSSNELLNIIRERFDYGDVESVVITQKTKLGTTNYMVQISNDGVEARSDLVEKIKNQIKGE